MYIVYSFSFFWFEAIYASSEYPYVLIQRVSNMLTNSKSIQYVN